MYNRIFCEPGYMESPAYAEFWKKRGQGECDTGATPGSQRVEPA
jgi:methyl-accepting chemotaxis protein